MDFDEHLLKASKKLQGLSGLKHAIAPALKQLEVNSRIYAPVPTVKNNQTARRAIQNASEDPSGGIEDEDLLDIEL